VQIARDATAIGFAAFAAQQIEGALEHRLGALKLAQRPSQGGISAPELLAQGREITAHLHLLYYIPIQVASEKTRKM
jgi:hypothetical protein